MNLQTPCNLTYHAPMSIDWRPLQALISANQRFVITSHVRPDADAIGSEIGLACALQQLGKSAQIVNVSPTPPNLRFLDPNDAILQLSAGAVTEAVLAADVHLIVDTSAWGQLSDIGRVFRESTKPRAVIDHHVSADDLGAQEFKDTARESTGGLIFELSEVLGVTLTAEAATALFAAVATDTGWYRFSATTGQTLRVAGALIDRGARPDAIFRELYEQATLARLKLAGRVLSRVTLDCAGQLAYTTAQWSDFEELGALASDTEDLVNEGLKIAGTKAAFIAIELQNRQVKVSFRSRNDVNVAAVAEQFGGGGHRQAAGATLPGPFADAVQRALTAMRTALSCPQPA
ncbi:MAG TPA: bifunctional oligoribonuclease/PAP phosphatase NrnA [Planctomycetaceae bacterium]|nr:bifunctional oligoribonuclease/PAP phosphatase NrnA [Planctomycetaceae bacterium]